MSSRCFRRKRGAIIAFVVSNLMRKTEILQATELLAGVTASLENIIHRLGSQMPPADQAGLEAKVAEARSFLKQRQPNPELIEEYVRLRVATRIYDSKHSTSYAEEFAHCYRNGCPDPHSMSVADIESEIAECKESLPDGGEEAAE